MLDWQVESQLAVAEELTFSYAWGTYDLLILPPSFPYGGMENPCLTFVTPTLLVGKGVSSQRCIKCFVDETMGFRGFTEGWHWANFPVVRTFLSTCIVEDSFFLYFKFSSNSFACLWKPVVLLLTTSQKRWVCTVSCKTWLQKSCFLVKFLPVISFLSAGEITWSQTYKIECRRYLFILTLVYQRHAIHIIRFFDGFYVSNISWIPQLQEPVFVYLLIAIF